MQKKSVKIMGALLILALTIMISVGTVSADTPAETDIPVFGTLSSPGLPETNGPVSGYFTWKGDYTRTGNLAGTGPQTNTTSWVIDFLADNPSYVPLVDGSPVISNGSVYFTVWGAKGMAGSSVTSVDGLYSYTLTGTQNWRNEDLSSRGQLTVWNGRIYGGTEDGKLFCADETSGKTLWLTDTISAYAYTGLTSAPIVCETNGRTIVYVVTLQGSSANLENSLYIFEDLGDSVGQLKKISLAAADGNSGGAGMFSSPSLSPDTTTLYAPGSGGVTAINTTTYEKLWTFDAGARGQGNGNIYVGTPVYKNGLLYTAATGKLYCINASTGKEEWSVTNPSIRPSTPVVTDTLVIAAGAEKQTINGLVADAGVAAYRLADGSPAWKFTEGVPNRASPIVSGTTVYFGTYQTGTLYAVNTETGTKVWEYTLPAPSSQPGWLSVIEATPAVFNGVLYIGAENGMFYAFSDNGPGPTPTVTPTPTPTATPGGDDELTYTRINPGDGEFTYTTNHPDWPETTFTIGHMTAFGVLEASGLDILTAERWGGIYVDSIEGLSTESYTEGWLYQVNGVSPNEMANNCPVENGDKVVWYYSDGMGTTPADSRQVYAYLVATEPTLLYDGTVALPGSGNVTQAGFTADIWTDLGALDTASQTGIFTYNVSASSYGGVSLDDINGITNAADWSWYWATYLNGGYAMNGTGLNPLQPGDVLTYAYLPYVYGVESTLADAEYLLNITVAEMIYDGTVFLPKGGTVTQAGFTAGIWTDLGALETAAQTGIFTYNVSASSYGGVSLDDINGITNAEDYSWYWATYLNGAYAMNGTGLNPMQPGDVLTYAYLPYIYGTESTLADAKYLLNITASGADIFYDGAVLLPKEGTVTQAGFTADIWTDLGALNTASQTGIFTYNVSASSWGGVSLNDINGITNAADWSWYWATYLNGAYAVNGTGLNPMQPGDVLTYAYLPYVYGAESTLADAKYLLNITAADSDADRLYHGPVALINGTLTKTPVNPDYEDYGDYAWIMTEYLDAATDIGVLTAAAETGSFSWSLDYDVFDGDAWSILSVNDIVSGTDGYYWVAFTGTNAHLVDATDITAGQQLTGIADGQTVTYLYTSKPTAGYAEAAAAATYLIDTTARVIEPVNLYTGPVTLTLDPLTLNISGTDRQFSGISGLAALDAAAKAGGFTYNITSAGWITDIAGLSPDWYKTGYGWGIYLNGKDTTVITDFTIADGDTLTVYLCPSKHAGMTSYIDQPNDGLGNMLGAASHTITAEIRIPTEIISEGTLTFINETLTIPYANGGEWTGSSATALGALDAAAKSGGFTYNITSSEYGPFLTDINNISGTYWWGFYQNGISASAGIGSTPAAKGDTFTFSYGPYDFNATTAENLNKALALVNITVGGIAEKEIKPELSVTPVKDPEGNVAIDTSSGDVVTSGNTVSIPAGNATLNITYSAKTITGTTVTGTVESIIAAYNPADAVPPTSGPVSASFGLSIILNDIVENLPAVTPIINETKNQSLETFAKTSGKTYRLAAMIDVESTINDKISEVEFTFTLPQDWVAATGGPAKITAFNIKDDGTVTPVILGYNLSGTNYIFTGKGTGFSAYAVAADTTPNSSGGSSSGGSDDSGITYTDINPGTGTFTYITNSPDWPTTTFTISKMTAFGVLYAAVPDIVTAERWGGIYIESINGLTPASDTEGWMYQVNGVSSGSMSNNYQVKAGDKVVWYYSENMNEPVSKSKKVYAYTVTTGSSAGGSGSGTNTALEVVTASVSPASSSAVSLSLPAGAVITKSGDTQTIRIDTKEAAGRISVSGRSVTVTAPGVLLTIPVTGVEWNGDIATAAVRGMTAEVMPAAVTIPIAGTQL